MSLKIDILNWLGKFFGYDIIPPENKKIYFSNDHGDINKLPLIKVSEEDLKREYVLSNFNGLVIKLDKNEQCLLRKISIKELGYYIDKGFRGISIFKDQIKGISRSYLLGNNKDNIFCGIDDIQNSWLDNPYHNSELTCTSKHASYLKIHLDGGKDNRSVDVLYFLGNKYRTYVRVTDENGKWCRWFNYSWDIELPIDVFQLDRILENFLS